MEKNCRPVSLLSMVSKIIEKLIIIKLVDHFEKFWLFCISVILPGLLVQLYIFSQLCLIELLRLLIVLRLHKLQQLIHPSVLYKLKSHGFSVKASSFILSFPHKRWVYLVLDGKYLPEYLINAGVSQNSILDLCFFLLPSKILMLSARLVSLLMILLSTLSAIRHLICGNN